MPYFNLGSTFDYAEMAYLMLPRPFMVERGHHDRVGRDQWVAHEYAKVAMALYPVGSRRSNRDRVFQRRPHDQRRRARSQFLHKHLNWPEPCTEMRIVLGILGVAFVAMLTNYTCWDAARLSADWSKWMNRSKFLASSSATLTGVSLFRLPAWAQQAAAPPAYAFNELRRGAGYFAGQGGTIGYVINGDGAIAVDSQFPATAAPCVEGLKQKAPKGIDLLHQHPPSRRSHGAAIRSSSRSCEHIVCQEKCLEWHKKTPPAGANPAPQAYADVTFGESWSTTIGDEKVWAFYNGKGSHERRCGCRL